MLDPIQYEFRFFQNTLADPKPEPGAGAETLIFWLRLQPKVSVPCGSGSTTLEGNLLSSYWWLLHLTFERWLWISWCFLLVGLTVLCTPLPWLPSIMHPHGGECISSGAPGFFHGVGTLWGGMSHTWLFTYSLVKGSFFLVPVWVIVFFYVLTFSKGRSIADIAPSYTYILPWTFKNVEYSNIIVSLPYLVHR